MLDGVPPLALITTAKLSAGRSPVRAIATSRTATGSRGWGRRSPGGRTGSTRRCGSSWPTTATCRSLAAYDLLGETELPLDVAYEVDLYSPDGEKSELDMRCRRIDAVDRRSRHKRALRERAGRD